LTCYIINTDNSKITPNKKIVQIGQDVRFHCFSYGMANWNFSEGPLPDNTLIDGNSLFINDADKSNAGMYECHGKERNQYWGGDQVQFYSRGTLTVIGKFMNFVKN